MSERDGAFPASGPDERLGDLFSNLPDPSPQHPTVDDDTPAPGSRRAAREAAARQPVRRLEEQAVPSEADAPAVAGPSRPAPTGPGTAPAAAAAAPNATRHGARTDLTADPHGTDAAPSAHSDGASAGGATTDRPVAPGPPAPGLGGGLDDLFSPADDHGGARPPRKKRRRGCLVALIIVLVILGGIAAAGAWVLNTYGDKIAELTGTGAPKDWEPGIATGETTVTISEGDTGQPVSTALFEAGVTRTEDVFYDYLISEGLNPPFYPGVYKLQKKMTAEAALEALSDDANRMENTVSMSEGATIVSSLPSMAESLGLPLADFEAAVADPAAYGVSAQNLEGWLFPAVYTFDPEVTATQVIQRMVDRTRESLAAAGVPDDQAQRVLTVASIIQREGRTSDFDKVARVIENRLAIDMMLQMDSTAQYGYGSLHEGVVSSSAEALADDNPWNTYVHTGLPATPIASPGDAAINAAMHPADGPWLYFVTIDLSTGETQFSETYAEHQAGIEKWQEWCRANPDAGC